MAATFRNFSTLFFVVAAVTVPVHLVHAFVLRDVIAVSELRPEIERLPQGLEIRRVSPDDLDGWTASLVGITLVEIGLLPLAARAARKVLDVDAAGGVPTATDAWRSALRREGQRGRPALPAVLAGAAVGWLVLFFAEGAGLIVLGILPDQRVWPLLGVVGGVARAISAPFVVVPLAFSASEAKDAISGRPTK